jgi:hypothetical protein
MAAASSGKYRFPLIPSSKESPKQKLDNWLRFRLWPKRPFCEIC